MPFSNLVQRLFNLSRRVEAPQPNTSITNSSSVTDQSPGQEGYQESEIPRLEPNSHVSDTSPQDEQLNTQTEVDARSSEPASPMDVDRGVGEDLTANVGPIPSASRPEDATVHDQTREVPRTRVRETQELSVTTPRLTTALSALHRAPRQRRDRRTERDGLLQRAQENPDDQQLQDLAQVELQRRTNRKAQNKRRKQRKAAARNAAINQAADQGNRPGNDQDGDQDSE